MRPCKTLHAAFMWPLLAAMLAITGLLISPVSNAQSPDEFRVDVLVADQGDRERTLAYRIALARVLSSQVETRVLVEPFQREDLLREPTRFVQSFRYLRYDPSVPGTRIETRTVREGAPPVAVLAVTFPADLAAIIQQQLAPLVEEEQAPAVAPVIALVAVEQQGSQFVIGGDRGTKFQTRATQLAAANNLQLQFPEIDPDQLDQINAADIFALNELRIGSFMENFPGNDFLTGALYRLSGTTWQSDWTYSKKGQAQQSFSLTTATLDEALVSAMTQISPGGGFLSSGYNDGTQDNFAVSGVPVRVENIRSLNDYDAVLATLRRLDAGVVTESIEPDAMVFRTSDQAAERVRNSLSSSGVFEPVDPGTGVLSFRYLAR